jgi:hypothetical protein
MMQLTIEELREGARTLDSERVAMTPEEETAMNHLVEFWERYRTLPKSDSGDVAEACRIARRADPDYWRKPE